MSQSILSIRVALFCGKSVVASGAHEVDTDTNAAFETDSVQVLSSRVSLISRHLVIASGFRRSDIRSDTVCTFKATPKLELCTSMALISRKLKVTGSQTSPRSRVIEQIDAVLELARSPTPVGQEAMEKQRKITKAPENGNGENAQRQKDQHITKWVTHSRIRRRKLWFRRRSSRLPWPHSVAAFVRKWQLHLMMNIVYFFRMSRCHRGESNNWRRIQSHRRISRYAKDSTADNFNMTMELLT
jgi:hypothetical protein